MTTALKWTFWISFVLAGAVYSVMAFWSLPKIAAAAGGAMPFDLRPFGYGFDEAKSFLTALSPEGRDFYLTVQHRLDLVYPALLAVALASGIAWLAPVLRAPLAALAVPGMVADYFENHLVAGLLKTAVDDLHPGVIIVASQATLLKSVFTTLAMCVFLALVIRAVLRRRQRA